MYVEKNSTWLIKGTRLSECEIRWRCDDSPSPPSCVCFSRQRIRRLLLPPRPGLSACGGWLSSCGGQDSGDHKVNHRKRKPRTRAPSRAGSNLRPQVKRRLCWTFSRTSRRVMAAFWMWPSESSSRFRTPRDGGSKARACRGRHSSVLPPRGRRR